MPFKSKAERNAYLARYREDNRDRIRLQQQSWERRQGKVSLEEWAAIRLERYGTAEEQQARRRLWKAEYRRKNSAAVRQSQKRYRQRNPEAVAAKLKKWRESPKGQQWNDGYREQVRLIRKAQRARRRGAPGKCSKRQLEARIAYYAARCYLCGEPWQEIDHVIPIARGGTNHPSNLRPACRRCNRKKAAHLLKG